MRSHPISSGEFTIGLRSWTQASTITPVKNACTWFRIGQHLYWDVDVAFTVNTVVGNEGALMLTGFPPADPNSGFGSVLGSTIGKGRLFFTDWTGRRYVDTGDSSVSQGHEFRPLISSTTSTEATMMVFNVSGRYWTEYETRVGTNFSSGANAYIRDTIGTNPAEYVRMTGTGVYRVTSDWQQA